MARPLRIEYPGAWYHVMNRGAGRCQVFPDDYLRQQFLDLLSDLHDRYRVCCHAYCLMGNHYHLLVQTRLANLGRAMQHLDSVYAQRHNRHLRTDGPLFRGRYKAQLIEQDSYLLCVSRYVHRNPLAAGLCDRLVDYPWSSYRCFAGLRPVPGWLHLRHTIAPFQSAGGYCAFVEGQTDEHDDDLLLSAASSRYAAVLGSKEFVSASQRRGSSDYEIPQSKLSTTMLSLDEIIAVVCARSARSRQEILEAADRHAREQRALAMLLGQQYGGLTLRDLADTFGPTSYTTVASAISRCRDRATRDPAVAGELAWLRTRLSKMRNA
ncbi:MAG: transposase [Gammaproteobacteria bacterium]|nr:transposase [Gammaproteobacteria bacterium]NNF61533.1 hypothetical protein [Gammaproteobacteria bacterium]NNM19915.1 hypothetical protein [Gammaproteobacteria bacterium]